jgi:hypothetical protein
MVPTRGDAALAIDDEGKWVEEVSEARDASLGRRALNEPLAGVNGCRSDRGIPVVARRLLGLLRLERRAGACPGR